MLDSLRSAAQSWVAKLLLGLLVLSFAIWGISDVFRGGLSGNAALTAGALKSAPLIIALPMSSR